jgi:alanyl-tRNA synthetase
VLGNWSFGTYGKEIACKLALDLLVNVYGLDMSRLFFTYFNGDKKFNLAADLETKNIWLKLGVSENNLLPFGMQQNFWEMDVVGPCGPCTEIHYDRYGDEGDSSFKKAAHLVNTSNERVVEIWNIVFMQYNRVSIGEFSALPRLVVDTGMGLERLAAILNNTKSNYETDLFRPLFDKIHSYSSLAASMFPSYEMCEKEGPYGVAYRILSDHMRTITVAIGDGLMPSRNGLGGFLKFLILKCMKICNETFSIKDEMSLLCSLVPVIADTLKVAYPDLVQKIDFIQKVNYFMRIQILV